MRPFTRNVHFTKVTALIYNDDTQTTEEITVSIAGKISEYQATNYLTSEKVTVIKIKSMENYDQMRAITFEDFLKYSIPVVKTDSTQAE